MLLLVSWSHVRISDVADFLLIRGFCLLFLIFHFSYLQACLSINNLITYVAALFLASVMSYLKKNMYNESVGGLFFFVFFCNA